MIDPKKELFRWGPIDGMPVYIDGFMRSFIGYPEFIDFSWPDVIAAFMKDDKVICIADYEKLREVGKKLFRKYVLDDKKLKDHYNLWRESADELMKFEKKINKGLSSYPIDDLISLIRYFDKLQLKFWHTGFLPELANWGGEQMLKQKLLDTHENDFVHVFEVLSRPEDLSFFQREELEFMEIKKSKDRIKERLAEHQKKYYWLHNSYGSTKELNLKYFEDEIKKIDGSEAGKKTEQIEKYVENTKKEKEEAIREHGISKEIENIAHSLSYCIWWQDYRKKFIFIMNHIITKFLEETERRKNVPFHDLLYYHLPEIEELLEKGKKIETEKRSHFYLVYYHEREYITYKEGRKAELFARPYLHHEVDPGIKELKGLVVSKGKQNIVRGRARILLTPKNANKMEDGEILVAPMTSPDFIRAMRKAAAIITDEGGITSHAAIVSRELQIPCIVGTKIATKLLKDGYIIEIDALKAIVKII